MHEAPLDGPPHPAIVRAISAYLEAADCTAAALTDIHPQLATVRRQFAAHYRRKAQRALAEVTGGQA